MPLASVLAHLPQALKEELSHALASPFFRETRISEIRLRRGRVASLSFFRHGRLVNFPLSYVADGTALTQTLARATGGSVYAFEEELREGYFPLPKGVRVGVSGKAIRKGDTVLSLSSVDSLVFRLPSAATSRTPISSRMRSSGERVRTAISAPFALG